MLCASQTPLVVLAEITFHGHVTTLLVITAAAAAVLQLSTLLINNDLSFLSQPACLKSVNGYCSCAIY